MTNSQPLPDDASRHLTRRDALSWLGAAGIAVVAVACGRSSTSASSASTTSSTSTAGAAGTDATAVPTTAASAAGTATTAAASTVSCVLTPEMTEGPYYLSGEADRSDITDGMPGIPLRLDLTVANATTCKPIAGAVVEVWHADAAGDYSGFGNGASSRTFLRGGQTSDANGRVTFQTVYPGWYQGRATHIHLKVHVNGVVHTTQLFFDEATNNAVYAQSPYNGHGGQRTTNAQDNIYSGGGSTTTLKPTKSGSGYVGTETLGVKA